MPQLIEPTQAVRDSFLHAMGDFIAEGRGGSDGDTALGRNIREFSDRWSNPEGFGAFIDSLKAQGDTTVAPPADWVHSSTYWWVDGEDYLGSIRIRHRLNEELLEEGGHIGYDIAPAHRRRGHGTAMLEAALPIAAVLGVDPALITCDNDNVGSRKIIEANGGVFEDERQGKLRYWVKTS
jgi:predicted acetyltransferase